MLKNVHLRIHQLHYGIRHHLEEKPKVNQKKVVSLIFQMTVIYKNLIPQILALIPQNQVRTQIQTQIVVVIVRVVPIPQTQVLIQIQKIVAVIVRVVLIPILKIQVKNSQNVNQNLSRDKHQERRNLNLSLNHHHLNQTVHQRACHQVILWLNHYLYQKRRKRVNHQEPKEDLMMMKINRQRRDQRLKKFKLLEVQMIQMMKVRVRKQLWPKRKARNIKVKRVRKVKASHHQRSQSLLNLPRKQRQQIYWVIYLVI
mmetsp:Transcript_26054/g.22786  ORF Transcript_26054/g.22786 Transcript_26054/m.22786 type:complete len:256 (+) Transcript_26054:392-1159(+)